MVVCDKWIAIKVIEVIFCISCLVCKRVTDDEAVRVSLYLQKISREWSLLRNITWSSVGSSFADAVYGGYLIITFGLLMGWLFGEVPRGRRILEGVLLGIGALFFIVLGGLELASLDSIPDRLIDNAAVLGVLSLVTAVLFLIDLAGARKKNTSKHAQTEIERKTFAYPILPSDTNDQEKNTVEKSKTPKGKFLPEKFKKSNKNDKKTQNSDHTDNNPPPMQEKSTDDVDTFMKTQSEGYHRFNEAPAEGPSFQQIEKTKYGSVRNGFVNGKETEALQKMAPGYGQKMMQEVPQKYNDMADNMYEIEMHKNMAYLKKLEDKNKVKYRDENNYPGEMVRVNDYKQRMSLPIESTSRSRMPPNGYNYEKGKHWETFEEESLPPFPVKEEYLPELQTPVFSRLKDENKGYGIYDNFSKYNFLNRKVGSSHTDSMRSKTSTLKSKPPTLQQIAEYFGLEHRQSNRTNKKEVASQVNKDEIPAVSFILPMQNKGRSENIDCNGEPISPTDPGYVQYTAQHWSDKHNNRHSTRTPRHSPTDR